MKEITGETKLLGILADPIHHVKAPQRMNEHFSRVGYDGILVPFHARSDDLKTVLDGLKRLQNLVGIIITVPHKSAVLDLCDHASDVTRTIGAANVIRRETDGSLTAQMLDGEGFVRGLQSCGHDVKGKTAYIVGAGGAGNAIAFGLVRYGVDSLTIYNRTGARAEDLKRRIVALYPDSNIHIGTSDPSGHDIVVNATSLGMNDSDPLPMNVSTLTPDQLVCEIIMQPADTPLLVAARERGCPVHYGAPMLASQIELLAEFLGIPTVG